MSRADAALAALAFLCGIGFGGCVLSGCPELDYTLRDAVYQGTASPSGWTAIGDYGIDDMLVVDIDAVGQTATLSFTDEGRAIELRYDVTGIVAP